MTRDSLFFLLITCGLPLTPSARAQDRLGIPLMNGGPTIDDAAFLRAMYSGNPATIEKLLTQGANPNAQLMDGGTALMLAVAGKKLSTVRALLKFGAIVDSRDAK